jgi:hypothetical protein
VLVVELEHRAFVHRIVPQSHERSAAAVRAAMIGCIR